MPFPSREEGALLLEVARSAIAGDVERLLERALERESLRRPGAAFVTLRLAAELRGCLGTLEARAPLARTVAHYAVAAAQEDPRFPPLHPRELPAIRLSVSVLGSFTPVQSPQGIVIGRHGVSLALASFRSVFLPDVALQQGWDVVTLLENLALKAGLRREDWREASLAVFETVSFAETVY